MRQTDRSKKREREKKEREKREWENERKKIGNK